MKQQKYNRAWAFALALIMVLTTTFGGFGFVGSGGAAEQVYAADAVLGDFTVSGGTLDSDYTYAGNVLTIKTAEPISIANVSAATATVDRIVVQSGITANITLNSVNIDVSTISGACALDITGATVNLTLTGINTLKSGQNKAGLQAPAGSTLLIQGGGSLTATGGTGASSANGGAGIGGGNGLDGGLITIDSGTITATGKNGAAGIGGGYEGNVGDVRINGGTIVASDSGGASGIGNGNGNSATGGAITISGGSVTATGNVGIGFGAMNFASDGTINITGGIIVATSDENGAGIGGGGLREGGNINISGGTVTATGHAGGAGIGGGTQRDSGTITISGNATVNASGGLYGAAIGGGSSGDAENITIKGNAIVIADGSDEAAGIGGGYLGNGGTVTISENANVTAKGGVQGAGIGSGNEGSLGSLVTIAATATVKAYSKYNNLAIQCVTGSAINSHILMITYTTYRIPDTKTEIRNSGGTVLAPEINWTPTSSYQSIAFTIPSGPADYMVYAGGQKYYQENTGTQVDQFAVTGAGLTAYTNVSLLKKETPTATIDFANQMLMGLNASSGYYVDWDDYSSNATGKIAIQASWYGTDIDLILNGDNVTTTRSDAQVISIPAKPTVAPTPSAILPTTIGGTGGLGAVNDTMEYKLTTASTYTAVPAAATSVNGLAVGSYHVRFKATATSFPGPTATAVITAFTGTPETTPTATLDYPNAQIANLVANANYTVSGAVRTADANGKITILEAWFNTLKQIVKIGNGTTTTNSDSQPLLIAARQAVTAATGNNPTTIGGTGSITNLADTMEYSADGASWTSIPAGTTSIGALSVDTYYVRLKATATSFAGATQTITITEFTGTPETTPNPAIDYLNETFTGLEANGTYVLDGSSVSADANGIIVIDPMVGMIALYKVGDGVTTTHSAIYNTVLSRPVTPAVDGANQTTIGGTGSLTSLIDTMEYQKSTDSGWTAVPAGATSVSGLSIGTYYIRIKATTTNFYGTTKTVVISAYNAVKETLPSPDIAFTAELFTNLEPNAVYLIDGVEYTASAAGTIPIQNAMFGVAVSMVKKGNATTTTNSDPINMMMIARPSAPAIAQFTVTQPVTSGGNGSILGITNLMQYTTNAGITWNTGDGLALSAADGTTVGIRVKATGASPCSLTYSISLAYTPTGGGSGGGPTATTVINTNTGTVTGNQIDKAVGIAKEGDTVTIQSNQTSEVTFPASGLSSLAEKDNSLTVVTENGTLTFDGKAVSSMDTQATAADIEVIVKDVERNALTQDQQTMVGDKSIYDLSVMSGGNLISNFGGGKITVSLPYELKAGETAENLTVWYLADDGTLTEISCTYDAKTKAVTFVVNHFSKYVVGYDSLAAWSNPFADMKSSDWYYDAVRYVSANGLMNGQTSTEFAAEAAMTRGMFVSILGRMENIDTTAYANQTTFSDVTNNQYYASYTAWANEKGIVTGVGSGKFAPDAAITREQMAKMMTNYMKYKGQGPVGAWAIQLTYADLDQVSSWAGEGVMFMTMKNVMNGMGKDANGAPVFSPLSTSTRAQAATMLQRLSESK